MHTPRTSPILIAAGLLTAVLLPSCSLPPGVAWREIQRDGLIPFIRNGLSVPKAQSPSMYANRGSSNPVVVPPQPKVSQTAASAEVPQETAPLSSIPVAHTASGLSGYVRSPFTNPPRLVDVRGLSAGAKVVCPYTQRPFILPAEAVSPAPSSPAPQIASSKPQPKPQKSAVAKVKPKPAPSPARKSIPAVVKTETPPPTPAPKVATTPPPQSKPKSAPEPAPVKKPKPVETPKVAATTPPPAPTKPAPQPDPTKIQTAPPPAPAPAPAAKLPYGTAISGRPGFVNSPYAEKHQLVDVTGLSVGTEVKCPYTGKLFRVPLQQQAKK